MSPHHRPLPLFAFAGLVSVLAFTMPFSCRRATGPRSVPAPAPPQPQARTRPGTYPGQSPTRVRSNPAPAAASKSSPTDQLAEMKASKARLRQIAEAMHRYNDANGSFPPQAVLLPDGTPGLSWRVLILPYLGHGDLFRQFNLKEPWDGPTNHPLLAKMPEVYRPVVGTAGDATYYQVFVGPGAAFEPPGQARNRRWPGVRLVEFTDGPGNTLLLIEGGETVPWTKPQDLVYQPGGPLPRIGGQFADRAFASMADGFIIAVRRGAPESLLRLAITRNDGENFDHSELWPR